MSTSVPWPIYRGGREENKKKMKLKSLILIGVLGWAAAEIGNHVFPKFKALKCGHDLDDI